MVIWYQGQGVERPSALFTGQLESPSPSSFLSACVQRLLEPTQQILHFLFRAKYLQNRSPLTIRVIHLLFLCSVYAIFFCLIPTIIFWIIEEEWEFLDATYFVFISLTTIGLGDFYPGKMKPETFLRELYTLMVAGEAFGLKMFKFEFCDLDSIFSGYLLVGMIFVSLTMTIYCDIPQLNLGLKLHKHTDIYYDGRREMTTSPRAAQ